jgi:hypothetical protein
MTGGKDPEILWRAPAVIMKKVLGQSQRDNYVDCRGYFWQDRGYSYGWMREGDAVIVEHSGPVFPLPFIGGNQVADQVEDYRPELRRGPTAHRHYDRRVRTIDFDPGMRAPVARTTQCDISVTDGGGLKDAYETSYSAQPSQDDGILCLDGGPDGRGRASIHYGSVCNAP